MQSLLQAAALATLWYSGLPALGQASQAKPAPPDAAAVKRIEKEIQGLFAREYRARDREGRSGLARKLLLQAEETLDDPASKYVLLSEAMRLAAESLDLPTSLKAVDELVGAYAVDAGGLTAEVLATARKVAKSRDDAGLLAGYTLEAAERFLRAEDFDAASKAAKDASRLARSARDAATAKRAQEFSKEILELKKEHAEVSRADLSAAIDIGDHRTNSQVGRYLCFVKGDWEKGLEYLQWAGDAGLKGVAQKELSKPAAPSERVSLADGWYDLARKEREGLDKRRFEGRARYWYGQALIDSTGLLKAKIEKRMAALRPASGPRGRGPGGLLGVWKFDEGRGTRASDGKGRNHGTLENGVAWVEGKFGHALDFDGRDDYVSVGVSGMPTPDRPQTIAWWYKVDANPLGAQNFLTLTNDAVRSSVQPGFKNGLIMVWKWGGTALVSAPPPEPNQWHHCAYTFDGSTHRFYLDGREVASSSLPAQTAVPDRLHFGKWTGGRSNFRGQLDEIRIYNRGLTAAEVRSIFAGSD